MTEEENYWSDIDAEDPEFRAKTLEEIGGSVDAELKREEVERLVRQVNSLEHQMNEAAEFINEEIAQARAHLESLIARRAEILKPLERKKEYLQTFYPKLRAWAESALQYSKARSIKLAYGTLRFRKNPDRLEVLDEDAAVQWAMANGYSDCFKTTFARAAAKARLKTTGEQPDGCELVTGETVFEVVTE